MAEYEWDSAKNLLLRQTRGVGFEDIVAAIESGAVIDDASHFNPVRYPEQRILVIDLNSYVYLVPYEVRHQKMRFITIFPSRKQLRNYLQ